MSALTKQEILDSLWELYREHCKLAEEKEGLSSIRFPDMESAFEQLAEEWSITVRPQTRTVP